MHPCTVLYKIRLMRSTCIRSVKDMRVINNYKQLTVKLFIYEIDSNNYRLEKSNRVKILSMAHGDQIV
jgi:hypothetical protein